MQELTGYRELSQAEIDLINEIKAKANEVGELCETVKRGHLTSEVDADKRWLAIAQTDLQKGFMSLVRAVAKPEGF